MFTCQRGGLGILLVLITGLLVIPTTTAQTPSFSIFLPLVLDGSPPPSPPPPSPSIQALPQQADGDICRENAPDFFLGMAAWLVETDPEQQELNLCVGLYKDNLESETGVHGVAYHGTAGTWFTTFPFELSRASIVLKRSQPGLDIRTTLWLDHEGERYQAVALWPPDHTGEYALVAASSVVSMTASASRLTGVLSDTMDMENPAWIDQAQADIDIIQASYDSLQRMAALGDAEALGSAVNKAAFTCEFLANMQEDNLLTRDAEMFRITSGVKDYTEESTQVRARIQEALDARGLVPR